MSNSLATSRLRSPLMIYCLIALAAGLAHRFVFSADFYMDDYPHILHSEAVRNGAWQTEGWRWLPYFIWSHVVQHFGYSGVILHGLNLTVHLLAACLVYPMGRCILCRIPRLNAKPGQVQLAAFLGAILFAVHPLGTEAVHYTRCLMINLVTLGLVLTAWGTAGFLNKPHWKPALLLLSGMTLSAISKQTGIAHALMTIMIIGLFMIPQSGGLAKLRQQMDRKVILTLAIMGVLTAFLAWPRVEFAINYWTENGQELGMHGLTQGRLFWAYALRMVWPVELVSDHFVTWSRSLADVQAVIGTLAVVLTGLALLVMAFLPRWRIPALLLALTFAPLWLRFLYVGKELLVEYRTYPGLPWLGLAMGLGLVWVIQKLGRSGWTLTIGVIGVFVILSNARSHDWTDATTLSEQSISHYPENIRALSIMQGQALTSGQVDQVLNLMNRAETMLLAAEEHNLNHPYRKHEIQRIYEHYAICLQLATYAVTVRDGMEEGLSFANEMIGFMDQRQPGYYLDPETGEGYSWNALIQARDNLQKMLEQRTASAPPAE